MNSVDTKKSTHAQAITPFNLLSFTLPPELAADAPPEARGLARDEVRLMVSSRQTDQVTHTVFREIGRFLNPGDLLVINTSGTMQAALPARRADGTQLELHLSTQLPANLWSVELRRPSAHSTAPFYDGKAGETLTLPAGATVTLHTPYNPCQRHGATQVRLWLATLHFPEALPAYLQAHGFPIRYSYVKDAWPLSYYQTVYATELGSAEMPSAGRAFTNKLITQLVAQGVQIAPLVLHTGVASLEDHEPPYEEYYRLWQQSARLVNQARAAGQRIIAVGTTAVRALETVADSAGIVHPGSGWTNLVITPHHRMRVVDGLLTGLHEPKATHLAMLEALAGRHHLQISYAQALAHNYLWHEFGDLHLILP